MKILVHGTIPNERPPWPIGEKFDCNYCHCVFEIEPDDAFDLMIERQIDGKACATVACPECRRPQTLLRPTHFG